ncbi:MAG: DUF2971 domain-containing protein [Alphaproteobacteria bacterium]
MNDISEVEHGFENLRNCFAEEERKDSFFNALNAVSPKLAEETIGLFDDWIDRIRTSTFITCLSEHDQSEDKYGRLSMWRAYQRDIGVALVLKPDVFRSESDALKVYSSPVAYVDEEEFLGDFIKIVENIRSEQEFLKTVQREHIVAYIFFTLLFAVTCSKNPGFHEEREWRLIHLPGAFTGKVDHLETAVEVIEGVPQIVKKIPLVNIPDQGLVGAEIPEILDRVIIGPSDYHFQIYEAFATTLSELGVEDASSKVYFSEIPLRT